jgi:hypothetical protein
MESDAAVPVSHQTTTASKALSRFFICDNNLNQSAVDKGTSLKKLEY